MRDVLGYRRFGAAGGDWGAAISILLGHLHPDAVAGIYVTLADFAPALRNRFEGFELDDLDDEERDWYERYWQRKRPGAFGGPGAVLRTPMTDAYAGHDSPLALAVAIGEARRSMQDHQGDVEHRMTDDELLTNVMLYWVTESWASARRFYWHTARDAPTVPDDGRLPGARSDGRGGVPGRCVLRAAQAGPARRQRHPVGPAPERWSRGRRRGAVGAGRRAAALLPTAARRCGTEGDWPMNDEPSAVVVLVAKPGGEDRLLDHLMLMARTARRDDGCDVYSVHRSRAEPSTFFLYERYRDKEAFARHRANAELQGARRTVGSADDVDRGDRRQPRLRGTPERSERGAGLVSLR